MNHLKEVDLSRVEEIIARLGVERDACIPILQEIQKAYGYLPKEALDYLTAHTKISARQVFGVASFYGQFRFSPAGRHTLRVCHGTACHVNGAERISSAVEKALGIKDRETTSDGKFTLETVACLGCCSLAPVIMIGETAYGRLTCAEAERVVEDFEEEPRTEHGSQS